MAHRVLPLRVPYRVPLPSMMMKPNFLSSESRSRSASVWNLLSHRYSDVLIGLNGCAPRKESFCQMQTPQRRGSSAAAAAAAAADAHPYPPAHRLAAG